MRDLIKGNIMRQEIVTRVDLVNACFCVDGMGKDRTFEILYEFDKGRISKIEDVKRARGVGKVLAKRIVVEYQRIMACHAMAKLKV